MSGTLTLILITLIQITLTLTLTDSSSSSSLWLWLWLWLWLLTCSTSSRSSSSSRRSSFVFFYGISWHQRRPLSSGKMSPSLNLHKTTTTTACCLGKHDKALLELWHHLENGEHIENLVDQRLNKVSTARSSSSSSALEELVQRPSLSDPQVSRLALESDDFVDVVLEHESGETYLYDKMEQHRHVWKNEMMARNAAMQRHRALRARHPTASVDVQLLRQSQCADARKWRALATSAPAATPATHEKSAPWRRGAEPVVNARNISTKAHSIKGVKRFSS